MSDATDQCLCCNQDFVAFEEKKACNTCGNTICKRCTREVKHVDLDAAQPSEAAQVSTIICKDCEFMGKWVKDVKAKDKGKFWNIKMPKRIFALRRSSSAATNNTSPADKKMPKSLNQKFSLVSNMLEKTRTGNNTPHGSQRNIAIIPSEIQQDLQALSREKLKEIHEQKKLISELQEENERMRAGSVDSDQIGQMKVMIEDLKKESESHISELEKQIELLLEQNARLKQVNSLQGSSAQMDAAAAAAAAAAAVACQTTQAPPTLEDPKFAKYRKMQKAGLPEGAVIQAASRDGVELSADFFTAPAPSTVAPVQAAPTSVIEEDPKFAKYRKMQKAGLPEGAILQAASRDGVTLSPDFFTAPAPIPSTTAAPTPAIVEEDPKFAKYRKMQKAGLPEGAIVQAASRDGIELPSDFFTGPAPTTASSIPAPVQEDPKFAKYRKMQKAGLPEGAIIQAASRDGIQLPSDFFSTSGAPSGPPTPPPLPGIGGPPTAPPLPGMAGSAAAAAIMARAQAPPVGSPKPKSKYEVEKRKCLRKSNEKQLRGIFWNVLPAKRVENSMWTGISDSPPFQIDSFLSKLEEDFAKVEAKKIPSLNTAQKEKGSSERPPLLDGKRQQNLGIALARFKEPVKDLKEHILKMDQNFFTMEVVHKLLTMVPTPEEVQAIHAAEGEWNGPGPFTETLTRVEQFVYEMAQVPRLRQRLQAVFVEMTFERQSECLQESIAKYEAGCKQLLNNTEWKKLLHLVLIAGNYLNSGNKSTGGAWGFEISTGLQKMSQSKATGNSKYSLLHWLAEVAEQKCPEMLELAEKLDKLEDAASINLEDLKADLAQLLKGCELVERELKACSGETFGSPSDAPGARDFIDTMKPFLMETGKPVTAQIQKSMENLETTSTKLLEAHGEVPSKCSASQLLATAVAFCRSLQKARDENVLSRVVDKKKKVQDEKRKNIADSLAATSKQLDMQIKVDKINKKLKNSFKKAGTKTNDSLTAIQALSENHPSNTA